MSDNSFYTIMGGLDFLKNSNVGFSQRNSPSRGLIFGHPGAGKGVLASYAPGALILDIEKGNKYIPVNKISIDSYGQLNSVITQLATRTTECKYKPQTIVIDSLRHLRHIIDMQLVSESGNSSISTMDQMDWGKGTTKIRAELANFLEKQLNGLINAGYNVIILSQETVADESDANDALKYKRVTADIGCKDLLTVTKWTDYNARIVKDIKLIPGANGDKRKYIKSGTGTGRKLIIDGDPSLDIKCRMPIEPDEWDIDDYDEMMKFYSSVCSRKNELTIENEDVKEIVKTIGGEDKLMACMIYLGWVRKDISYNMDLKLSKVSSSTLLTLFRPSMEFTAADGRKITIPSAVDMLKSAASKLN